MNLKLLASLLLLVPVAVSAQSMNAAQFHERATALQAKGMMALFSGSEIKALMAEGQAAGARAAANRKAALAAGKQPRFCPPAQPVKMGNQEFMRRLSAIPASQRAEIDMTEATTRILAAKFPCRG